MRVQYTIAAMQPQIREELQASGTGTSFRGKLLRLSRSLPMSWKKILRLDRPPMESQGALAAYYGSVLPGVWSFQLAARARGIGSAWTTLHLDHEDAVAELLGIPPTVTQVCLLAVGYYTGTTFTPAPRRPATEVTYLNRWKSPVE